jgi:uncharacterized membrane protein
MRKIYLAVLLSSIITNIFPCTTCNKPLQEAIYDSTFFPNLGIMLSAFFVLTIIIVILTWYSTKKHQAVSFQSPHYKTLNPVPLTTASIILGIGLGGFIDGIWLHQILQWHEMLSNKVTVDTVIGKSVNMFWDGVFHFFCLLVVLTGVILLWKLLFRTDINRSKKLFSGGLLLGWGLFNLIEGVIDHHLLKLHYVRQVSGNPDFWNLLFLVVSVVMLIIGGILIYKTDHYNTPENKLTMNKL